MYSSIHSHIKKKEFYTLIPAFSKKIKKLKIKLYVFSYHHTFNKQK